MSNPSSFDLIVPGVLAGKRLDQVLAALAEGVSRGEARRLIAAGVVFVNGQRTGICSRAMRTNDRVSLTTTRPLQPVPVPALDATGGAPGPTIAVERDDLWIVDKPAGMPVEPTRAGGQGTVVAWFRARRQPAFITHRLDVATSGLLVVARTAEAQAELNRLFAAHAIQRRYLAVCAPAPAWNATTIDAPLDGRRAVTHAIVISRAPTAALLRIELETGRTRQIRRHLATAGHPIVGETQTGHRTGAPLLLHAYELTLPALNNHPPITTQSPPPPAFTNALTSLSLKLVE